MRLVELSGGLGNQMFQYAFSLALRHTTGERVCLSKHKILRRGEHNGYELQRIFGVEDRDPGRRLARLLQTPLIGNALRHLLFPRKVRERALSDYDAHRPAIAPRALPIVGIRYSGYWQSPRYFAAADADVRRAFTFNPLSANAKSRELLAVLGGGGKKRP